MKRLWTICAAALSVGLAGAAWTQPAASSGPVVMTEAGAVRGEATATYRRFLRLPYAAPPVGARRWTPPAATAKWTGVRDATVPSPACLQPPGGTAAKDLSEDCLYLDVVAPLAAGRGRPRPVMVWVHGGGFSTGGAMDYDGRRLAVDGDVVVVTINYRLGSLGFFGLPGLKGSGEFGLQDQRAALAWVRRNIAVFGGDPRNVTLFGESAGAMSTCAQLTAPGSRGLFDKAIMQSGSCIQSWPKAMIWPTAGQFRQFVPLAELQAGGLAAAEKLGCKGSEVLACLRAVSGDAVLKGLTFAQPAFGGDFLPEEPAQALAAGRVAAVPVIWGFTHDEWRSSAGIYDKITAPMTPSQYETFVRQAYGADADKVLAAYPPTAATGPHGAAYLWAAVSTDGAFACPTLRSAQLASRGAPAFLYDFADEKAPNPAYPVSADFDLAAAHATDLSYIFDLDGRAAAFTPSQKALADTMVLYWSAFARSGKPTADGKPAWTGTSGEGDHHALALAPLDGGTIHTTDMWRDHHCDLWAQVHAAP